MKKKPLLSAHHGDKGNHRQPPHNALECFIKLWPFNFLAVVLGCLSLLLVIALSCSCKAVAVSELSFVRWVDDGDTVVLSNGTRVRYIGINAPEVAHDGAPAEYFGPEARTFNRDMVLQKKVRLELDRERFDQYRRLLAYVFLENGTFANAELIRQGYAYYLFRQPNKKYEQKLLCLQREAMSRRAGLWKCFEDKAGPFIGNKRSLRFHETTCPFGKATSAKNRIILNRKYDAFWSGYFPCKRCNP